MKTLQDFNFQAMIKDIHQSLNKHLSYQPSKCISNLPSLSLLCFRPSRTVKTMFWRQLMIYARSWKATSMKVLKKSTRMILIFGLRRRKSCRVTWINTMRKTFLFVLHVHYNDIVIFDTVLCWCFCSWYWLWHCCANCLSVVTMNLPY